MGVRGRGPGAGEGEGVNHRRSNCHLLLIFIVSLFRLNRPPTPDPDSGGIMTERIHNFSAGPAVLPLSVLEEVQRNMLALPGVGMSIVEISHRSKAFDEIIQGAQADMRKLAGIPDNYHILFLQGGASLQFSMVPMNLLPAGGKADYVVTGSWSKKAVKEAQRIGTVNIAATTEGEGFKRVPKQ